MQENIVPRQWERQHQLNEIDGLLDETRVLRSRVLFATYRSERLEDFSQELNALTGELERLQKRGALLMRRQQYGLQASAYEQVTETRNRLKRFSASAHEGLADLYHRALRSSREREQTPDEAAPQSSAFPLQPPMGSSR
ncbi:hypothetical protein ADG881_3211 [Alcanivorax sp. DG881]|nr:hypothetical protein ADG881_3211 [Alcanivorax sp. DG881]